MSKLTTSLILDDEETSRAIARSVLEDLGFTEIVEAESTAQALKLLKSMPVSPQLILSDVFLQEGDLVEFLKGLAKQSFRGGLIFMSSKDIGWIDLNADLATALGLNCWGTLTKPLFVSVVDKLIADQN